MILNQQWVEHLDRSDAELREDKTHRLREPVSMILDLHVHTTLSGDAKPTAEEYAFRALAMQGEYRIDGFVITEHRYWDYRRSRELDDLAGKTGLIVFQGVELETDFGHILIYGVTPEFLRKVDITARTKGLKAVETALECGCFPIAAHPARPMLGCGIGLKTLKGIRAIEILNGGSSNAENFLAETWMKELDLKGIGGSDAHYISELGICMTKFDGECDNERDLVKLLSSGAYQAIHLDEARRI